MNNIKLIASDLDGTLLLNGKQNLDEIIFRQIKELKKQGIVFMAASGREYTNLRRLFSFAADDIAYLCLNGCLTFYHGTCISKEVMDEKIAIKLINMLQADVNAEILISGETTCYIKPKKESYYHLLTKIVQNDVTVNANLSAIPEPYTKIAAYFAHGVYENYPKYAEIFKQDITVQIGGECWLDFTPKNVNKSTGFQKLLKYLNISATDTVMFGDNDNDCQILQAAGYPIAMINAVPSIKQLCPYQVQQVSDGINIILQQKDLSTLLK